MSVGVPKTAPRVNDSLRGLSGLSIIILMTIIYCSKRIQSNISTERSTGQSPELFMSNSCLIQEAGYKHSRVLPVESHRTHLISPKLTTGVKYCMPGTLVRDSGARVFIGGWSHGHPLARLPEEKQGFSINDAVYKNNFGTVSHS